MEIQIYKEYIHSYFINGNGEYTFEKGTNNKDSIVIFKNEYNYIVYINKYSNYNFVYSPPTPESFYSFINDFVFIPTGENPYKIINEGVVEYKTTSQKSDNSINVRIRGLNYITLFFKNEESIGLVDMKYCLSIYPNPVFDEFNIVGLHNNSASVKIFDMYGRMHFVGKYREKEYINISTLKNGIYVIMIEDNTGVLFKSKIKKNNSFPNN